MKKTFEFIFLCGFIASAIYAFIKNITYEKNRELDCRRTGRRL